MIHIRVGTVTDCSEVLTIMLAAFAEYRGWPEPKSGVFQETAVSLQTKL